MTQSGYLRLAYPIPHIVGIAILFAIYGTGSVCYSPFVLVLAVVIGHLATIFGGDRKNFTEVLRVGTCSVVWLASLSYILYSNSATSQLESHIADPLPASVVVKHYQYYSGKDPKFLVHFKIAPQDLPQLLHKYKYDRPQGALRNVRAPEDPAWWQPWTLKNPTCYSYASPDYSDNITIYVSEDQTEVYLEWFCT